MNYFAYGIVVIGKIIPDGIQMLGSGFFISKDSKIVTAKHVIGDSDKDIVVLLPRTTNINDYQDSTDTYCNYLKIKILESDPFKDICIIQPIDSVKFEFNVPGIGSLDDLKIGDDVEIFGYPHCTEGRRVLTYQNTKIGAKLLLSSDGIKSKHAVLNIQSRPGQSGSVIYSKKVSKIIGILIGAYAPSFSGGISLGGIDPRELHQTTHCISSEYIKDMIND